MPFLIFLPLIIACGMFSLASEIQPAKQGREE